jgi:predicted secreted acid phosphatase
MHILSRQPAILPSNNSHPAVLCRFSSTLTDFRELDLKLAETQTVSFQNRIEAEVKAAQDFIADQVFNKGNKGFVVLDVDETSVDNREYYQDPDRKYYRHPTLGFYDTWDAWIEEGRSKALPHTKALINWLNENNIPYCFVTGRIQKQEERTTDLLKGLGLYGPACRGVYCKPNDWTKGTTASHKRDIVAELEKRWKTKAIASIGDLPTDGMLTDARRNFILSCSSFYPPRR